MCYTNKLALPCLYQCENNLARQESPKGILRSQIRYNELDNKLTYITLPLTQHAMHCTLTQFNWTTRTHCTNTTYLLSLDTIQCTSMTLHMNNLLHLCTTICCSTNLLLIYNLLHLTLLLCMDYIMYRYCT